MWSDFGGKIDSEVWKASMHSTPMSLVFRSIIHLLLSVCICAFGRNSLLWHKHVRLMLQHKCNCSNHSILSCLMKRLCYLAIAIHSTSCSFLYSCGSNIVCPSCWHIPEYVCTHKCANNTLTFSPSAACPITHNTPTPFLH